MNAPATASPGRPVEHTVIEAGAKHALVGWGDLWRYRELLGFLAWRDLRVRYRQTLLGAAWALLEPFASVILFTLLFNRLAGFDSDAIPYPLFCYAGVLLWSFFHRALRTTTVCLVANAALVTKAYFPRLVLPLSGLLPTLVDFCCALLMFFVLAAWFGVPVGWPVLTLPFWVLLAALNAMGVGLILASVNVRFRDVSQAVPFLAQIWMFATPVAYPLKEIPARWLSLYLLNPMVGVVEGVRWALLPNYDYSPVLLLPSFIIGFIFLIAGLAWFQHTQRRYADIV